MLAVSAQAAEPPPAKTAKAAFERGFAWVKEKDKPRRVDRDWEGLESMVGMATSSGRVGEERPRPAGGGVSGSTRERQATTCLTSLMYCPAAAEASSGVEPAWRASM